MKLNLLLPTALIIFSFPSFSQTEFIYDNAPARIQKNYIDSIFSSLLIDTSNISRIYFASDVEDWLNVSSHLDNNTSSCTDYLIFYPRIDMKFDTTEYHVLMNLPEKKYESFYFFLEDNLIRSNWYKVYENSKGELVKLERLGTDININFGEVISTAYYKENLLSFYANNECLKRTDQLVLRTFSYSDKKIVSEELFIDDKNKVKYINWTRGEKSERTFLK